MIGLVLWSLACGGQDRDGDGALAQVDCDDRDVAVRPGADEVCNEIDDDCDGVVDESGGEPQYWDGDGDGFGTGLHELDDCTVQPGYSAETGDCDDADAAVNPGATEICGDGLDNDCGAAESACRPSEGTLTTAASAVWINGDDGGLGGRSVAGAGDVDADGLDDVLVGSPHGETTAGQVVLGLAGQLDTPAGTISGAWPGDYLGWAVSGAGDLDGDGHDDFLLGAWGRDDHATNGGAVYVVPGPFQGVTDIDSVAVAVVHGGAEDARLGWSLDGSLMGAWREPNDEDARPGAAWVVADPLAATGTVDTLGLPLWGEADQDAAGFAVAQLGDVDGDGIPDFAIGAPGQDSGGEGAGAVYLVRGPVTAAASLAEATGRWTGTDTLHGAGASVSTAGDQDQDGLPDLLVGSHRGQAWVVAGTASGSATLADALVHLAAADPGTRYGQAVSGPGDVDGDGADDLWLGVPNHDSGRGAATLLYGPVGTGVQVVELTWTGEFEAGHAGTAVAGAGDVDGNGLADLLVGGPDVEQGGLVTGQAWLLPGVGE